MKDEIDHSNNSTDAAGKQCQRSLAYEGVIEAFARNIYDPSLVGNLDELKSKHNCEIKSNADAIKFANAEMTIIDSHSQLFTRADIESLQANSLSKHGVPGLVFDRPKPLAGAPDAGPVTVDIVAVGSAAEQAGVKVGDQVLAVDGKPVDGQSILSVMSRMPGQPGTSLDFTVKRDGRTFDLDIKREQLQLSQVVEKNLTDDIAYFSISDFQSNRVLLDMSNGLRKHENAEAVVLDLRNNSFGKFENAVHTAALFINKGKLYTAEQRLDSPLEAPLYTHSSYALTPQVVHSVGDFSAYVHRRLPDLVDVPLVVLVNEGTALSAEMLAGALRQNADAKLVGSETFGNGVGRRSIPIPALDSILAVTNGKFQTASGEWLGDGSSIKNGLEPDILVAQQEGVQRGSVNDTQLNAAILYLQGQIAAGRNRGNVH